MSYSTTADVRIESGFTDNTNITDPVVQSEIDGADAEINGYVSQRYSLPFVSTPPLINQISRILAAGHLMFNNYGYEDGTGKDQANDKITHARDLLERISKGELSIVDDSGNELDVNTNQTVKYSPTAATPNKQIFNTNDVY